MVKFLSKLVSNKYCSVKLIRTISIAPHVVIDGEEVAKGSTLNLNNITKEGYKILCNALGVNGITEDLPIYLELRLADGKTEKGEWKEKYKEDEEASE